MKLKNIIIFASAALAFTACGDDKFDLKPIDGVEEEIPGETETPGTVNTSSRNEQYRPQVHFTPAKNWINDPNGMVYADGVWHLYYQYNPQGNSWGNMSWGHATSTDLIHWDEKPVAMVRNEWGDIFSGSAVIDKDNVAGFGKNAIIAFYTGSGEHQQQCMAYSTDGGLTYTQYEGNPIIPNTVLGDFRDPKVVWHQESGQWIMCLALGWSHQIEFWGSKNLKDWSKLSTFISDSARSNIGQWECPDLLRMPYKGGEKWVLIVSNNPGGPVGGSGTEYFVGNFDGTEFVADPLDYPLWIDYGADNYAGVTWSNSPDGEYYMIGWMNNWNYCGDVPCKPWRSAMTLPRKLTLKEVNGLPVMASAIVDNIDKIASDWKNANNGNIEANDAYVASFKVNTNENSTVRLENSYGQYLEIEFNAAVKKMIVKRTSSTGDVSFHNLFAIPTIASPYNCDADEMEVNIYVDRSSIEIFNADGTMCSTNLVFPKTPYNMISGASDVKYRTLSSIW